MDGPYILLIFVFTSVELFLTQGLRLPLPKDIEGEEIGKKFGYIIPGSANIPCYM